MEDLEEIPDWPPYLDGTKPLLIDISQYPDVKEGDAYDLATGKISRPPVPEE